MWEILLFFVCYVMTANTDDWNKANDLARRLLGKPLEDADKTWLDLETVREIVGDTWADTPKLCWYWENEGQCPRGPRCRYSHVTSRGGDARTRLCNIYTYPYTRTE